MSGSGRDTEVADSTVVELDLAVDLLQTLGPLVASRQDPTIRLRPNAIARAAHTPQGPGTVVAERLADAPRSPVAVTSTHHSRRHLQRPRFRVRVHGPGGGWLLERVVGLLGGSDDLTGFRPELHRAVARAAHGRPGLRMVATGTVADVLVPTIIAQRVTSLEAARAWTRLVRTLGSPAPGPLPLLLPPHPATLTRTPAAVFHQLGIERARARRIVRACAALDQLDAALSGARGADRLAAMTAVEGVGPWTAAHLVRVGAGDADAVEVGDDHAKHLVAWNLAGEARATDERMLALLSPFAGHRGRVVRLLASAGQWPPRFGHRHPLLPVERL